MAFGRIAGYEVGVHVPANISIHAEYRLFRRKPGQPESMLKTIPSSIRSLKKCKMSPFPHSPPSCGDSCVYWKCASWKRCECGNVAIENEHSASDQLTSIHQKQKWRVQLKSVSRKLVVNRGSLSVESVDEARVAPTGKRVCRILA